jgi:plastocyanin
MKPSGRRRTHTTRVLAAATAAVAFALVAVLGGGSAAPAATVTLYASVGPGYTITLKDAAGAAVTQLAPGTYTIVVNDQAADHNFHLIGPGGVDMTTTVPFVGQETWTVTLVAGSYHFVCDPHADGMFGDFTVVAPDTTPPDTSIGSGPSASVNSTSATIAFSSNEAGSRFECALDAAAFAACTSPKAYTALANGQHTFQVRAIDAAGNVDASPASRTWTVDTVAPDTTIASGPSGTGNGATATFGFTSNEAGASFQCALDSTTAYSACASPKTYSGLASATHTFRVRAVDGAGNVDATPASRSWGVDATPPETTITVAPSGVVASGDASFEFRSSKAGSTFQCALDAGAFAACSSPQLYSGIGDGSHTFQVRAVDASGNPDASPASRSWTIDTTPPQTVIDNAPSANVNTTTASISFSASELGSTFECSLDGATFAPCTSPQSFSGLAAGAHAFEVRATDALGNLDTTPASAGWTIDTTAPETTLNSGPTGTVGQVTAAFAFSASEPGSTFACALDGAPFGPCTSPQSYTGLAEGTHTFQVRATDAAGNVDATPVSRSWTIDTGALYATVGPGYTISLAGAAGTPITQLAAGSYRIVVKDLSTAHNFHLLGPGIDKTTTLAFVGETIWTVTLNGGSYHFQCDPHPGMEGNFTARSIDTTPPETTIDSGPSGSVASASPGFGFSASEAGSTFQCSLDGAAFTACSSPQSYVGLPDGAHSFQVRATDAAGNADPTPAARTWTIDTAPPDTNIDAGPAGSVTSAAADFRFSASEAGAVFKCSLDGGSFAACASPASYLGLAGGGHTFRVEAIDTAGNVDPTPAGRSWTVVGLDTTPPTTTIDSGPSAASSSGSASFAFSSSENGSSFECSLDGGPFAACTSPQSYSALSAGPHTFEVKATDAAGNVEATPARRTWTIDSDAPETTIVSGPSGTVASGVATFEFSAGEVGSTFECGLDAGAMVPCSSPQSYSGLSEGSHTFQVKASDVAGNADASPASRSWTVALPPETSIDSGPTGTVASDSASFSFSSSKAGAGFECALDGGAFSSCTSPKSYAGLSPGEHTFQARAADPSGTADPTPAARTWTVAPPAQLIASGLAYNVSTLTVPAGQVTLSMRNDSVVWHNIAIRGNGVDVQGPVVGAGGVSTVTANLAPGTYEFYCSVPGHAEAGMKGTLIVGEPGTTPAPPTQNPPTPSTPPPSSAQLVAGGLAFNYSSLSAEAGTVTISMFNDSAIPHNVAIRGNGVDVQGPVVGKGGVSSVTAQLAPGTYEFYCSVPGHADAGMKGTLIVTEPGTKAPASVPAPTVTETSAPPEEDGHEHETSAPKVPPALNLSCATGLNFTLSGRLLGVAVDATSVALRVQGAKARTAKARKQARRYVGKQLTALLYAKTGLKREGKAATVADFVAGDKVSVDVRLCKVNRRGALRPIAAAVAAQPVATGGAGGPAGALQLTATEFKFDKTRLEAKAGKVTITLKNTSPLEHNVAIRGNGVDVVGPIVKKGGTSTVTATLAAGDYEFYCSVPGHEQAGMKGVLVVTP